MELLTLAVPIALLWTIAVQVMPLRMVTVPMAREWMTDDWRICMLSLPPGVFLPARAQAYAFRIGVLDIRRRPDMDLARAIARLDPAHSEVITLRFVHGLSLQETASALDVTVDAIKGRQARALAALREILAPVD